MLFEDDGEDDGEGGEETLEAECKTMMAPAQETVLHRGSQLCTGDGCALPPQAKLDEVGARGLGSNFNSTCILI